MRRGLTQFSGTGGQAETMRVAHQQEMKALVMASRAELVRAESEIPLALANAIREGQFHANDSTGRDSKSKSSWSEIADPILKFPSPRKASG